MQDFAKPLFRKGRVLKKESLEALRDFPGGLAALGLSGWSDGILYGFDISYEAKRQTEGHEPEHGVVIITAGAVWHQGQIVDRANIGDCKPMVNVGPFGVCKMTHLPCVPACAVWLNGKTDVLVQGLPALLDQSMAVCPAGAGILKIKDDGQ